MEMPLFPLHMVLFPGVTVPLRIFEPRYRALLETILSSDRRFGVVAIRQGQEMGGPAEVFDVGTLAQVDQVSRHDDGSASVVVTGLERFHVAERLADDPFPRAEVVIGEDVLGRDPDRALTHARAAVHRYLSVVARLRGTELRAPALGDDDAARVSYILAATLDVDLPERQRLLECRTVAARLELATDLARREALLLEAVGPSVGRPQEGISPN